MGDNFTLPEIDHFDARSPFSRGLDYLFPPADTSTPGDPNAYIEGLFSSTGENILQSMEYNSAEAQKNRDFQERLANSAYQRAVEDLKRAGLNPLLAYGAASQAATPSSTSASVNAVAGDTLGSLLMVLAALMSSSADIAKVFSKLK